MVSETVNLTKLVPPDLPENRVARPRALNRVTGASSVVLINILAGSGKTTLAAEYARRSDHPVLWLTLDPHDNQPGRLLRYLVASFQQSGLLADFVCDTSQDILREDWDAVESQLSNALVRCGRMHAIVLDNLECVRSDQVTGILDRLLQIANKHLRWILVGRGGLAVRLGRLRISERLTEVTLQDLSFSASELEALCAQRGVQLPADEVYQLLSRTGGWVVGIQLWLSAYKARTMSSPRSLLSESVVSLAYDYIAQYVFEELIRPLSVEQRHLVKRTVPLHTFQLDLARELCPGDNVDRVVGQVVQSGLLLVRKEAEGDWYRYPGLLASVLRRHWMKKDGNAMLEAHRLASTWYLDKGFAEDAIHHATRSGDIDLSWKIMLGNVGSLLNRGSPASGQRKSLDLHDRQKGDDDAASLLFDVAFAIVADDGIRAVSGIKKLRKAMRNIGDIKARLRLQELTDLLRTLLACIGGNARYSLQIASSTLERAAAEDTLTAALRYLDARAALSLGLLARARERTEHALAGFQGWGRVGGTIIVEKLMVEVLLASGDLSGAQELVEVSDVRRPGIDPRRDFYRISANLSRALVFREQVEMQKSEIFLQRAIKIAVELNQYTLQSDCYYNLARHAFTLGDDDRAIDLCREGRRIAEENQQCLLVRQVDVMLTRVALRRGDGEAIDLWLSHWDTYLKLYGSDTLLEEKILYVRIQLDAGHLEEATRFSNELIRQVGAQKHVAALIELNLLQARIFARSDDNAKSWEALDEAVSLARETGLMRVFCETTPAVVEQLQQGLRKKRRDEDVISPENVSFVEETLLPAMYPLIMPEQVHQLSPLADLTKREMDVLDLISKDNSNQKIAETLFISVSTVKTHINNIFSKLNVDNRKDAIRKARGAAQN